MGPQNGTPVHGTHDENRRSRAGLILTHTQMSMFIFSPVGFEKKSISLLDIFSPFFQDAQANGSELMGMFQQKGAQHGFGCPGGFP